MRLPSTLSLAILSSIVIALYTTPQKPLGSATNTLQGMSSLTSHRAVPGDSPACYVGDPSNDTLTIEALDLIPNPPVDHMTLRLAGVLKSDVGAEPRIKITVSLNNHVGPQSESPLCFQQGKIEITQNGTRVCPPRKGSVLMEYSVGIPYWVLKKGNYTVGVEMHATNGSRMTAFEGTVFVNGRLGDGDGGW